MRVQALLSLLLVLAACSSSSSHKQVSTTMLVNCPVVPTGSTAALRALCPAGDCLRRAAHAVRRPVEPIGPKGDPLCQQGKPHRPVGQSTRTAG